MLGMLTVLPSTTFEFSDSPLAAASARVVKLLAAAIDQSDSPGWTTCGTPAEAGAAATRAVTMARPKARCMFPMTSRFPIRFQGDSRYGEMHERVQRPHGYPLSMASRRQIWVGGVPIGGGAPVAVQTMTKTETADFDATMRQIRAAAEAGA